MLTRLTSRPRGRFGFTLIELLVVVGIIALLISFLMPVLRRVRIQAKRVQCASNLRQMGQAIHMYANDNKNHRFGNRNVTVSPPSYFFEPPEKWTFGPIANVNASPQVW